MATLFGYPRHDVTGAAMMLVAVVYSWLAPAGSGSAVGCFCAGVIL